MNAREDAVRVAAEALDSGVARLPLDSTRWTDSERDAYERAGSFSRGAEAARRERVRRLAAAVVDALLDAGWRGPGEEPQRWIVGIGGQLAPAEREEKP